MNKGFTGASLGFRASGGVKTNRSFSVLTSLSQAFTLVEVLLTLLIIGVVSAIVLSAIVSNYQEKALLTQFQGTYSALQQAYLRAAEENGTAEVWPDTAAVYANLKPYMKIIQDCPFTCRTVYPSPPKNLVGDPTTHMLDYYHFLLANGSTVKFAAATASGVPYRSVTIDTNGNKGPNRLGYDVFIMHFTKKNGAPFLGWPFYTNNASAWTEIDAHGCSKSSTATDGTSGYSCSYWIIKNGNMDYLRRDILGAEWRK